MTSRQPTTFIIKRPLHLKESTSSCILKDTKKILINSNSYNTYLDNYQTKTKISTFQTPTISLYPLYRDPSTISLVLKQYQTSDMKASHTQKRFPFLSQKDKSKSKTERKLRIRNHSTLELLQSVSSLRDQLLYEVIPKYRFTLLRYDESIIFHNRRKYNQIIYDKIMQAKEKVIENYTIEKKYVLNEKSSNEIILTINSMKIEFNNLTDKNKKPLSLDIPFSYLFLFYYKGIDYFKDLLLGLIHFTNDQFDSIELNDGDIPDLIKHSREDFNKLLEQTNDNDNTKDNYSTHKSKAKESSSGNIQTTFTTFQGAFAFKKALERKSSSYYSKINVKPHYHIYNYIWNTPNYVYDVNIRLPEINVILPHQRRHITKEFEDELFLYILEKNFLDWDFYVISYLFSLKSFRMLMKSTLSKRKSTKLPGDFTRRLSCEFEKINISTNKTKTYSYLDDSAIFYYTNSSNENYIQTLHSFSIKVDYNNLNPHKRFLFEFNFNQMKLLNRISQYENLERFIKKIVITEFDIGEINIDYSMFNNFNENYFDGKIFKAEGANLGTQQAPDINAMVGEAMSKEKIEMRKREMKIKIEKPWIEKTEINKLKFIINEENKRLIPSDVISEFCLKEILEWPKILLENRQRLISRFVMNNKKNVDRKSTTKIFRSGLCRSPTSKPKTSKLTQKSFSGLMKINEAN